MVTCSINISVLMWSPSSGLTVVNRKACEAKCKNWMLASVSRLRREKADSSIRTEWQCDELRATGLSEWLTKAAVLINNWRHRPIVTAVLVSTYISMIESRDYSYSVYIRIITNSR